MLGYLGVVTLESSRGQTWSLARALDFNFGVFVATHSVGRQGPSRRGGAGGTVRKQLGPSPAHTVQFLAGSLASRYGDKAGQRSPGHSEESLRVPIHTFLLECRWRSSRPRP